MAIWMCWVIEAVVVFGSLSVLAVAVVALSRLAFAQSAKIVELSLRKPFYLCEVERGDRGVCRVIPINEASAKAVVAPPVEPPEPVSLDVHDEYPDVDPDEVHLSPR